MNAFLYVRASERQIQRAKGGEFMPIAGTGTLTEFGRALDVGENYRWRGGDQVNQIGAGGGEGFKDTFTGSLKLKKIVRLK